MYMEKKASVATTGWRVGGKKHGTLLGAILHAGTAASLILIYAAGKYTEVVWLRLQPT